MDVRRELFEGKVGDRRLDKIVTTMIEREPAMDMNEMHEYFASIRSLLPDVKCMLNELLPIQLEVNKNLMTCKTQMEDR